MNVRNNSSGFVAIDSVNTSFNNCDAANDPMNVNAAATIFGGRLGMRTDDGRYGVSLFTRNRARRSPARNRAGWSACRSTASAEAGGMLARVADGDKLWDMKPTTRAPAASRRPQAERSATTQAKLIEAAIRCIHRLGYGATTVTTVAEEAGVSRGAMTHQFKAKTDLMVAVVVAVFKMDSQHYQAAVERLTPSNFMRTLPSIMWEVLSQPSAIAVMEIMLAARSDADLAEKLREIQERIDRQAHEWVLDRHRAAGIEERAEGAAIHRVLVAAVRGLALEAVFIKNQTGVEKSIAVLAETIAHLYPRLSQKP